MAKVSDAIQGVHIARYAVDMHTEDACGARRHTGLHAGRIDAQGFRVDVGEHRGDVVPAEHMRRGREGEGGGDDFTGKAQRLAGHDQGDGAVVEEAEVGHPQPLHKLGLEGTVLLATIGQPAAVPYLLQQSGVFTQRRQHRPGDVDGLGESRGW
mgnify:FL=1